MKNLKLSAVLAGILFILVGGLRAQDIFNVIKSGNLAEVKNRISINRSLLDSTDERRNTLLLTAISRGFQDIAKYLIAEHANLNASNNYQLTPLHMAMERKNVEIARILLENGANVNSSSQIFGCPIHRAVYAGSPEMLNLLLDNKANPEAKDPSGKTPLMLAGMLGKVNLAEILVNKGADINTLDPKGTSALHFSILFGQDRDGTNHSSELAKLLIGKGAQVTTVTIDGVTPICSAAGNGYTDIVKIIHEHGGDIHWISKGNSQTLLHIACIKGFGDLVDYLLDEGLEKNQKDLMGLTACDYALKLGHGKIAKKLSMNMNIGKRSEAASKFLASKIQPQEAFIWHLNNRGWAIKTHDQLFVFDNEENGRKPDQPSLANGWISSKEISKENIIALYSAYHAAPNTMEFIHKIEDSLKSVVYLHYLDDAWRGGRNSRYLKGREIQQVGGTEIIPYETHDSYGMGSLGYLVKTKGLTFFYPNFFPEDTLLFKKEIDFLAQQCSRCDFAIVEVTPGTENVYAAYIIEKLKPGMVIPYDRSRRADSYEEFKNEIAQKYPATKVRYATLPGERINYKGY